MNKHAGFLQKLFIIAVLLSWHMSNVAFAEDDIENTETEEIEETEEEDTTWGIYSNAKNGTFQTICPAGQYVHSCGSYKVGYNWLKSVTLKAPNGTTRTTQNYYVGNDTFDYTEQLRAFFNKHKIIKTQNNSGISTKDSSETDVEDDKDFILGILCNPLDSSIKITCEQCPDGGTVSSSSVKIGKDTSDEDTNESKLIRKSWVFNTIADCYITDFEDATGSFIYISPVVQDTDGKGEKCYYTNTGISAPELVGGDDISDATAGR